MTSVQTWQVLFVDDDPDAIDLYTEYFDRRPEIEPVTADSAADALTAMEESNFDCVVSDSVSTADGDPLVSVAKRKDPTLPVAMYSASDPANLPTEDADAVLQKGAAKTGGSPLQALEEEIRTLLTEKAGELVHKVEAGDAWQTLGTFDWAETPATTALLEALDEQTAVDPMTAPPLYEALDPDALERLLQSVATDEPAIEIHFEYAGMELTVSSSGAVRYRPLPRLSDSV